MKLLRDRESFEVRGYSAQPLPWSVDELDSCRGMVAGTDYSNSIRIEQSTFPDDVVIEWAWPPHLPLGGYFWGYNYLAFGDYNGDRPGIIAPVKVKDLHDCFIEATYLLDSGGHGHNVLCDIFLTGRPNDMRSVVGELGVLLFPGEDDIAFLQHGKNLGVYRDQHGEWRAVNAGLNPMGVPYYVLVPQPARRIMGKLDLRSMMAFLIGCGAFDGHVWCNGIALGVEPHQGSGRVSIQRFSAALS